MEFSDIIWFCGMVFILIYVVKPILQLIIAGIITVLGICIEENQKKSNDLNDDH